MFRGVPEGQNVLPPGGEAEMVAEVVKDVAAPVAITVDPANNSAADSLLPIIQSQRERYRLRAQELEAVRILVYIISCCNVLEDFVN